MLKKTFALAAVLALMLLAWPAPCAADEPAWLPASWEWMVETTLGRMLAAFGGAQARGNIEPDGLKYRGTTERRGNIEPAGLRVVAGSEEAGGNIEPFGFQGPGTTEAGGNIEPDGLKYSGSTERRGNIDPWG